MQQIALQYLNNFRIKYVHILLAGVQQVGRVMQPPEEAEMKGRQNEYIKGNKIDFQCCTNFKLLSWV